MDCFLFRVESLIYKTSEGEKTMHISRLQIVNFRNFENLDIALSRNAVIVGENRTGKSNLILAIRLVLDAALTDSARQLKLSDIWDGVDLSTSPEVAVHIDFSDFDTDTNLLALLTDYRLASDHTTARLSYVLRKKGEIAGPPTSEADFEFKTYGGDDETRSIRPEVRRRIALNVLGALRDAEADLGTWRTSPLRPLLEEAIGKVAKTDLDNIASDMAALTKRLASFASVTALETALRTDISNLSGAAQDLRAKLGFAPADPARLYRALQLFIDDGRRSLSEASVGSANLALLALKLAEFEWRAQKKERNFTILAVEEPEAHLHPHLQRQVFNQLLTGDNELRSLFLTTHSPQVASVAPLASVVVLRSNAGKSTSGYSLAELPFDVGETEDIERYLNATRAELLFSRGVIFVEGDSELALAPVFAASLKSDLDELGITVCSVAGTNFRPYVRLAVALALPFAVLTDWDPIDPAKPLGRDRALNLIGEIRDMRGIPLSAAERKALSSDNKALYEVASKEGIFLNSNTFETEIAATPGLVQLLLSILEAEHYGPKRKGRIADWKADPGKIDVEQLLSIIGDIGKGRVAGRLAAKAEGLNPPAYFAAAIKHVTSNV